ncbi:RNA methyltransferase [Sporanaerobium hydrogeniformans]|uniref:RNA methyltransferase n=1 Tax=Sporanaerobium hydrogeniformans TaxID=3072179 RepID=A0AC61DB40_9FIRM|nr:methyltransferase domain-containing protein [Sporanaerobium hydrogeniformans]PHV69973.1 RNA methyltransferase [Sporanaerobium hydrogeniformans]
MIRETYEKIVRQEDIRKNLIQLRQELKVEGVAPLLYYLGGNYQLLSSLLEHEDAKVRKNVALIMGELRSPELREYLWKAYQKEEKLFVKADYLSALSGFNYSSLVGNLKERLTFLTENKWEEASLKHINEEKRALTKMILDLEQPDKHTFTGNEILSDLLLLTNRDHREITLEQIKKGQAKVFNAGVVVRTKDLNEIFEIRTYSDLLFRLKEVAKVDDDPALAAQALIKGGLVAFLKERHKEPAPFYFRLELKTQRSLDKKSIFAKKMAEELERLSNRELINSTSNYEIEIRLIESKDEDWNVLLKLYTLIDERFSYRKEAIAASIQPVHAALITRLAKPYLKEKATVLDPFCGVGTMLIERQKLVEAENMYGIDSFGEAILKAAQNSALAGCNIHFINKNFFDFTHKYLVDEIFTNMPTVTGRKTEEEIKGLYKSFFSKALEFLKQEAIIVLYTRNKEFVEEEVMKRKAYSIREMYPISKKENAYLYILQVHKDL